jgi:hypothetical protein
MDGFVDEAPPIQMALAAVMADVTHVGKDGKNTAQGYSFRGIDGVLNAVGPALRRHGVVVMPHLENVEHQLVEVGKNRTPMRQASVTVRYCFHGPAGDWLDCVVAAESMDSGDKATSKAMSVALRTALIQALALPTHEPDPDESSYERSAKKAKKAPGGRSDIDAPSPPPPPTPISPAAKARRALNGEPPGDQVGGQVDTLPLRTRLNTLEPVMRGKVKGRLILAGLPSPLPGYMDPEKYEELLALVEDEAGPLEGVRP